MLSKLCFSAVLALSFASQVYACGPATNHRIDRATVEQNNQARTTKMSTCKPKIAIDNVRVFNGHGLDPLSTVVIDGDVIGTDPTGATKHIDGNGGVLLPGLIDSHCHPGSLSNVQALTSYGVTTAFMMACYSREQCASLQGHHGLVDLHGASAAASAPGSVHGNLALGMGADPSSLVYNTTDAARWVDQQMEEIKPEFIKIVAETPGLSQATLDALVSKAKTYEKKVVCHAADFKAHHQATLAGVDQIHHVPSDKAVGAELAEVIRHRNQISVPTLSIMKAMAEMNTSRSYAASQETVRVYKDAHIPILAGTDANSAIAVVPFGESLHAELELLVEAGLTPLEALVSATSRPAEIWGLHDRGVIAPGKRADLLLIQGDPIADIKATRNIKGVWVAGEWYNGTLGA